MKNVVLAFVVAFSLAALTTNGFAQKKTIYYYATDVMNEIDATPEQRIAIKNLVSRCKEQITELKSNGCLSKEEVTAETKKLTSERAKEYWKFLTP